MCPHLFVYGTLRPAYQNSAARRLRQSSRHVACARIQGRLYQIAHYPGFVPSDCENNWVYGDVYLLHSPEITYAELDKYEGCSADDPSPHEYYRSTLPVSIDSGAWIEASVYVYALDIGGKQRITSGDYRACR